jgi:hypothetical protein
MQRYRSVTPAGARDVAARHLGPARVAVSVVPRGRPALAIEDSVPAVVA